MALLQVFLEVVGLVELFGTAGTLQGDEAFEPRLYVVVLKEDTAFPELDQRVGIGGPAVVGVVGDQAELVQFFAEDAVEVLLLGAHFEGAPSADAAVAALADSEQLHAFGADNALL